MNTSCEVRYKDHGINKTRTADRGLQGYTSILYNEPFLVQAVEESRKQTIYYQADDYPLIPDRHRMGRIVVTKSKTFQAATGQTKTHPGQRIAVLNFACPTDPGGSVKWGSSAQEGSF